MVTSMDLAGILPTIKCSNCGTDVEISAMGDHVCSKPAPGRIPPLARGVSHRTDFAGQPCRHPLLPTRSSTS